MTLDAEKVLPYLGVTLSVARPSRGPARSPTVWETQDERGSPMSIC